MSRKICNALLDRGTRGVRLAALLALTPTALAAQAELQPILATHILGPHKFAVEGGALLKPQGEHAPWWPTAAASLGLSATQLWSTSSYRIHCRCARRLVMRTLVLRHVRRSIRVAPGPCAAKSVVRA
jgi:hypothetical protein